MAVSYSAIAVRVRPWPKHSAMKQQMPAPTREEKHAQNQWTMNETPSSSTKNCASTSSAKLPENIAAGFAPDEARRQAVLQLGAAEGVKEDCREQRRGFWMETLCADGRYGVRMLSKNWRLTSLAVCSLGVAMAVSVIGLSVWNTVLLRPPTAADPGRLVTIYTRSPTGAFEDVSYPDYQYYRDNNQVFSGIAAFPNSISKLNMSFGKRNEVGTMNTLSDNYFTVMGIRPMLGRLFVRGDDDKKSPSAVLSYSCWKRWGADPRSQVKR